MKRLLVVCYGGGHSAMVIPVVRALLSEGRGPTPTVLAATTAGPDMKRAGIPACGYRDLLRDGDDRAVAYGHQLLTASHNPNSGISEDESVAYLGLCYDDLVERVGADDAARRYERYGRHAFFPLGPLRRAFDRFAPDVVLTTNSPKSERAALVVAREREIPAVYLEDLLGARPGIHPPFVPEPQADRYCVCTTIAADNLVRRMAMAAEAIRMTGNPAFDRLARADPGGGLRFREELGVGERDPLIVYMDPVATDPELVRRMALAVRRAVGSRLVVRRHPNNRHMSARDYLDRVGADVLLGEDHGLDEVLIAATVVVSIASTTAVEALLVGRPVIQLGAGTGVPAQTGIDPEALPLYRYGATLLAEDFDDLSEHIVRAMDGAAQLIQRGRELFVPPGGATHAIVNEITELAI
jgi:hypothetical protein